MADIDEAAAQEDVSSALDGIKDSVAAFTYDGDRTLQDHLSGAPEERDLVLGDDDPRDAGLAERPLTEDVVWTGRIFNVDRLQVQLPDGRTAIRDVVRHPGAVAIVALTDEGRDFLQVLERSWDEINGVVTSVRNGAVRRTGQPNIITDIKNR